MELSARHCSACGRGTVAMPEEAARLLLKELPGWHIKPDGKWLTREFRFADFAGALAFVNRVGEIAEAEQHHPDITFGWGYARVELQTHAAGGLHENDFIVAARVDLLEGPGQVINMQSP